MIVSGDELCGMAGVYKQCHAHGHKNKAIFLFVRLGSDNVLCGVILYFWSGSVWVFEWWNTRVIPECFYVYFISQYVSINNRQQSVSQSEGCPFGSWLAGYFVVCGFCLLPQKSGRYIYPWPDFCFIQWPITLPGWGWGRASSLRLTGSC